MAASQEIPPTLFGTRINLCNPERKPKLCEKRDCLSAVCVALPDELMTTKLSVTCKKEQLIQEKVGFFHQVSLFSHLSFFLRVYTTKNGARCEDEVEGEKKKLGKKKVNSI